MNRSPCNKRDSALGALVFIAGLGVLTGAAVAADQAQPAAAPSSQRSLLEQAAAAEGEFRFDVAAARLYELLLEHPRAADTGTGRLRLARLLALSGDVPAAILQCQAARNELPADHPTRRLALDLATTLSRRLRAANSAPYFPSVTMTSARGVTALDEPTAVDFHASGSYVLVDSGSGRAYQVTGETATVVAGIEEGSAAAILADGGVVAAGKNGLSVAGAKPALFSGAWGGKTRQLKKVRSMAATANGELLVIDKDFDGLLRCKPAAATCAPWGPPVKLHAVKVDASDFVYLLDDHQQTVRVLDPSGRQIASAGPLVGTTKLGEILDIAVDAAYGLYLLDKQTKHVELVVLRSGTGKQLTVVPIASAAIPTEGDRSLKNPSAIGVAPDGTLIVAGRSAPRLLRLQ